MAINTEFNKTMREIKRTKQNQWIWFEKKKLTDLN